MYPIFLKTWINCLSGLPGSRNNLSRILYFAQPIIDPHRGMALL